MSHLAPITLDDGVLYYKQVSANVPVDRVHPPHLFTVGGMQILRSTLQTSTGRSVDSPIDSGQAFAHSGNANVPENEH